MAVREFDGVDDGITLGPGTLQSFLWGDFTYAFIVKRGAGSDGDNGRVFSTRTAVTGCFEALFNDGSPINTLLNVGRNPVDVDSASSFTVTASSDWVVVGADKATGTNAPRSHRCVMSTGTWTHSDNPNTLQNQATSMGALGAIEIGICSAGDPSAFFAGRYAVGAIWSRRLSDAEWETLDTSLQNWVDLAPDALWAFNQASVATPVEDLSTVGTADQTAITGTTVITTDDPPGFDFTLGPVREFDGTDDRIDCAIGALSGMTFGTVAAIVKAAAGGASTHRMIACLHDSGSNFVGIPLAISSGDQWRLFSTSDSVAQTVSTAVWYTVVVRKATGTVTPRFSVYNHGTGTWSHQNGSSSQANWTAPGASGTTRFNFQGTSDRFNGRVAVRAAWSNAVHWTADASGDTAIEAAGLEDSLQNWIDEIPDALWAFNQASVATPVDDLSTGGTADQTAITGTTVITTDAPPGFSFTLGAPAVPNLFVTRSNLSLR